MQAVLRARPLDLSLPWALTLLSGLALSALARYVLLAPYLSVGGDGGNYLTTLNAFLGADPTGEGLQRPPGLALYLWPFVAVLGPLDGLRLAGVIASVLPGLPLYALLRRMGLGEGNAVWGALVGTWVPGWTEMLSWGWLTYLALFLSFTGLLLLADAWRLDDEVGEPGEAVRWRVLMAGVMGSAVMAVNPTAAPIYLLASGLMVLPRLWRWRAPLLWSALLGLLLAFPSIPYLYGVEEVGTFSLGLKDPMAVGLGLTWGAGILAGTLALARWGSPSQGVIPLLTALGLVACLQAVTSHTSIGLATVLGRTYEWGLLPSIALAVTLTNALFRRIPVPARHAFFLSALVLSAYGGALHILTATEFYGYLTDADLRAMDLLSQAYRGGNVASDYTLQAWHLEGLKGIQALHPYPTDLFPYTARVGDLGRQDRAVRCVLGMEGAPEDCDPCRVAREWDIRYAFTRRPLSSPYWVPLEPGLRAYRLACPLTAPPAVR